MTVAELIAALQKFDPTLQVVQQSSEFGINPMVEGPTLGRYWADWHSNPKPEIAQHLGKPAVVLHE